MRTQTAWTDRTPDHDGYRTPVTEIAFRPDGLQLICAAGTRVLVYDASMGDLLHSLKGHKDTVYTVSFSGDGKRFASGGGGIDKTVIIWNSKGDGVLKYQHSDAIQAVAYNPVTLQLASVTASDFGLWAAEQKNVGKHKLPSKGLCCAWTNDGQHLAIGLYSGIVSIRARTGEEKVSIKRSAPVWTLAWNPCREEALDILCVGSWDQKMSFYHLAGKQIGRDKDLGFDPCCVSYFSNGEYLLVSGSNRKAGLYTKDGTFLVTLAEAQDWVWSVKQRPKQTFIALATNDGAIAMYQLMFATVHSIYQDQYVYRESMTDVIVQQLGTDRRLKIQCKDYVKKVAVYRDRLAVQLSDKIIIYDLFFDDQYDLMYKEKDRIRKKLECSLLCCTSSNIVLCQDKRLTSYDFHGTKRREWSMDSVIRYIKVVGGLSDREALLVGLKNGAVMKLFVDNTFPMQIVKLNTAIRCLDLSASRRKLAVVDENATCQVFAVNTKEMLFQERNANAVAWNSDFEDMLCFTGNTVLNVKTGDLPAYQQKLQGFVVGFKANKVFSLHFSTMSTVDVPHSHALYRYVEKRDFQAAYRIACLGITEGDWKMLGMHAMTHLQLDIARKAFIRIREVKFVELLNRIEMQNRAGGQGDEALLLGDILAFQGKYQEAAKCFVKCGQESKAIEMFCDMKMWEDARKICTQEEHLKELIRRQARWAEDTGDTEESASLWLAAGEFSRAIRIMGESGMVDKLWEVVKTIPKSDTQAIQECGAYFRKHNALDYAIKTYERIGDSKSLLQLYVQMNMWEQAFRLSEKYPQYAGEVYVPWAGWLATNDRFEEAQEAFKLAKRPKEALRMMEQLASNAVVMYKFADASYYFTKLAQECGALEEGQKTLTDDEWAVRMSKFHQYQRKADVYAAFALVRRHVTQPFTSSDIVHIYNAARFLAAELADATQDVPFNVSKLEVLMSLANIAAQLEMNKLARNIYEKLQHYVLPAPVMERMDLATMVMRGRPYQDKEEHLSMCYRCGHTLSSLQNPGDRCPHCGHRFIRDYHSFDVLPLVEFELTPELPDSEAVNIITTGAGKKPRAPVVAENNNNGAGAAGGADVITFNDELVDTALNQNQAGKDPFTQQMMQIDLHGGGGKQYIPIRLDAENLRLLKSNEVFTVKPAGDSPMPIRNRYFRHMVPNVAITMCPNCNHFFRAEDFEFCTMRGKGCPVCRWKKVEKGAIFDSESPGRFARDAAAAAAMATQ